MIRFKILATGLSVIWCILLSGCGFTPLYNQEFTDGGVVFADIEVSPIPERLGQIFRSRLVERLGSASSPLYQLNVVLDTEFFQFGLRGEDPGTGAIGDGAATQEQVTFKATYTLLDLKSGDIIYQNNIIVRSSFDLVLSDFAIITQREDTVRRLALQAAEKMERELALYFNRFNDKNKDSRDPDPDQNQNQQEADLIIEPIT